MTNNKAGGNGKLWTKYELGNWLLRLWQQA